MSTETRALELKVGIFVAIGIAIIAAMVLKFGLIGQGLKGFYPLTIQFPDANGLVQGSDVLLAGARIGYVTENPRIATGKLSVVVPLKISEDVKIPRDVKFVVGSSGLLGDRFVNVIPAPDFDTSKFNPSNQSEVLQPGAVIKGSKAGGGIEALGKKGEETLDDLRVRLASIGEAVDKIKTGILSDQNINNLQETFANLKKTSDQLAAASKKIDAAVEGAQGVVDTAQKTMTNADKTMISANAAAGDLRDAIADARKAINTADEVLETAKNGKGLLPTLLNDQKVSADIRALAENLRIHGVLFYKNSAVPTKRAQKVPLR